MTAMKKKLSGRIEMEPGEETSPSEHMFQPRIKFSRSPRMILLAVYFGVGVIIVLPAVMELQDPFRTIIFVLNLAFIWWLTRPLESGVREGAVLLLGVFPAFISLVLAMGWLTTG